MIAETTKLVASNLLLCPAAVASPGIFGHDTPQAHRCLYWILLFRVVWQQKATSCSLAKRHAR